jgi:hypothetical protein
MCGGEPTTEYYFRSTIPGDDMRKCVSIPWNKNSGISERSGIVQFIIDSIMTKRS